VPRAVRARGESLLDALLSGQAWIALVALLLTGIVFFNVDLLRLNRSIAQTSEQAAAVARENARLRMEVARLGSSERIQRAALERGMILPSPGDVRFRRPHPTDAPKAAANARPAEPASAPAQPPTAQAPPGIEPSATPGTAPSAPVAPGTAVAPPAAGGAPAAQAPPPASSAPPASPAAPPTGAPGAG